jgi:hypothetical protein
MARWPLVHPGGSCRTSHQRVQRPVRAGNTQVHLPYACVAIRPSPCPFGDFPMATLVSCLFTLPATRKSAQTSILFLPYTGVPGMHKPPYAYPGVMHNPALGTDAIYCITRLYAKAPIRNQKVCNNPDSGVFVPL